MNKLDLHEMQLRFECLQCGKCCKYGGDMELTADEVGEIVMCTPHDLFSDIASEFIPVLNKPGFFKLVHTFPCAFNSVDGHGCVIYHNRPVACRRYPFESFACGETSLAGVTICEGASRLVCAEFCVSKEP